MTAATWIPARGNPLAPQWMGPIYNPVETPAGKRDRMFVYGTALLALTPLQTLFNQELPIDADADFIARELMFMQFGAAGEGGAAGSRVRFRDGSGNWLSLDFIKPVDIEGPIYPELFLAGGRSLFIDVQNTLANNLFIQIMLRGVKRSKL